MQEEKPILPCNNCDWHCETKTSESDELILYTFKPCEKYREFRKKIGEWWEKHGKPKD